ncbi:hypothetical protein [Mycobacterium sp.]|uniref:hypothetical protein n=1 Tax=Mycobacterium sp. TaxID=1785 RepID=UPI003C7093BB
MFADSRHSATAAPANTAAAMVSHQRSRGNRHIPTISATTPVSAAVSTMCSVEKTIGPYRLIRVSRRAAG